MSVENKYVNADLVAGKKAAAALVHGAPLIVAIATFETAAANDDGSVFRLFKVNPHYIPVKIDISNDAITGGTDWDLGLYEALVDGQGGTVIDKDIFADGIDLSSAHLRSAALDGLVTVDAANSNKAIYQHAGHSLSELKPSYDIALTANTIGSGVGTVTVVGYFAYGQQ